MKQSDYRRGIKPRKKSPPQSATKRHDTARQYKRPYHKQWETARD